jgi:hypothetical protein
MYEEQARELSMDLKNANGYSRHLDGEMNSLKPGLTCTFSQIMWVADST